MRTTADLYSRVADGLEESLGKLRSIIKGIRGIEVDVEGVRIRWRGRGSTSLIDILERLNLDGCSIIILDEVQSLRNPIADEVRRIIAYSYDNLDNIMVVVSGSEVGMLRDFIGIHRAESPLYGRYALEILVDRFTVEQSREFLERGFREEGFEPSKDLVDAGVEMFDGIVGWLVFYGRAIIDRGLSPEDIMEHAVGLARSELMKLGSRERLVLKAIANGARSWSQVRSWVTSQTGETIPKSSLTRVVRRLERLSLIREY